ncbi:hypothetical protein [Agreia bicolorata]|nr:hypothetical protein [Agreia bicolorata]
MRVEPASARRRAATALAMVFAVLLMVAGIALVSARASAALVLPGDPNPQPGAPGYLSLETSPDPLQFIDMSPGDVGYGQITMSLDNAATARIALEMYAGGELLAHPNGVVISIASCDVAWAGIPAEPVTFDPPDPGCGDNPQPITSVGPGAESDGTPLFDLGTLDANSPRFILVEVRMPDVSASRDESLMGLSGDFAFHVLAEGDDAVPTTPPTTPGTQTPGTTGAGGKGGLANTGLDVLAVVLIGSGAIALGMIVRYRRTLSPRRSES